VAETTKPITQLTPKQYHVLREKGTDPPFQGEFTHPGPKGLFRCAGCGAELFSSKTQFDSGSGWPSFTAPVSLEQVQLTPKSLVATAVVT
jgi:peptide-methionine (R)-S-oxide reductase